MRILLFSASMISIMWILTSCGSDIYVPVPTTTLGDVRNISIQQVYYNIIDVRSNENLIVRSKDVEYIIFGEKQDLIFIGQDTTIPTYTGPSSVRTLRFAFRRDVDLSIIKYDFTLRFLFFDSSWVELDTFALMYKYPYESAEVFLTTDLIQRPDLYFDDFDRDAKYLFFHSFGFSGVFQYHLDSRQLKTLVDNVSGDVIASDSVFVFYQNGLHIFRYNLMTRSTDLELGTYKSPYGMDIYDGELYVIFRDGESAFKLSRFDFEGNHIDSRPYERETYYMTIYDDVVYSMDYSSYQSISRFDLRTNTFLENRDSPAISAGIRIYGDRFYYSDGYKAMIGSIPLSEIE